MSNTTGNLKTKKLEIRKHGFEAGDTIRCIKAESCAYTEGGTYDVYLNDWGFKCIKGDDGLEDLLSMVVSSFKKVQ